MLVIQSRSAYLLARMNKLRDRISNSDTKKAEERTGIVAQAARQVIVRSSQASVTAVVMGIETAVPA